MTKFDGVTGPERDEEVIAIEVLASLSETNSLAASQAHMLVPKLEQTGQHHAELMGDMDPRQYELPQQPGSHGPPRYRGVVYNNLNRLWKAGIAAPGRSIRLGAFSTAEAAARMYDNAALRIRGANAVLNFPRCDYVLPSGALALDLQVEALLLEELLGRDASSSQNEAAAVLGGLVEETGNEDHISDLVRQCLGRINQADPADLQEAAEALGPDYNRLLSLIRDAGQLLAAQSGRSAGSDGGVSGRGGSSAFGGYGAATRSEGAMAADPNGVGAAECDSRYAGSENVEDRVVGDGVGRRGYSSREVSIGRVAARSEVLRPSGRNQHADTGRGSPEGAGVQDEAARPDAGALRAEVPSSGPKAPAVSSRGGQQEDQAARPQLPSAAPWQPPPRQHVQLEASPATTAAGGTWPGDVATHAAEGGKADKVDGTSLGRGGGKDAGGGGRGDGDNIMEDVGRVSTAAPVGVESAPPSRGPQAPQSVPPPASPPGSSAAATTRAPGMDTVPFIPPIVTAPHMPPNFMHNVCHLLMTHIQQAAKARASQPPGSLPPPVVIAVRELEQNGLPLAQLLAAAAHLAACNLLPPEDYQAMHTALWSAPQAPLAAAAFFTGVRGGRGPAVGIAAENARESVPAVLPSVPHVMDRDRGAPNDNGAGGDAATRGKFKAHEEAGGDTAVTDAANVGAARADDPPAAKLRIVEDGRQPEEGLQAADPMAGGRVAPNYPATVPTGAAGYDTSTSLLIAAATAAASAAAGLPPGIPMDPQEQARVAAATAAAIAAITDPVLSPLSRGSLLPTRTGPGTASAGTASGSSVRQQLGLGRRLFSAISSQLPPGAELHCLLPPCDGYLGVLYTHGPGSHQVGAALWDGGSITNLGAYSSERDARQCIAANAGVRQQFANRTTSMITTSPGRNLRGGGSAGAPLAQPPLAPSGSVLTDMSGSGGSIIAAAAAAAARNVFKARGTPGAAAPASHNNSTGLYKSAVPRCGNGGGGSSVTGSMPQGPVMPGSVAPARPAAPSQPSQVSYAPSGSNCSPTCTEPAATPCGNGGMARDVTSGGAGVASGDGASGGLAHTRPGPMGPAQALVGMKRPSPLSATAPTGGVAAAVVGRREPPLPYNRSRSSVAVSGAVGAASPGSGAAAPELEAVGSSIPRPVVVPQLVGPPTTGPDGSLELVCRLQVPGREALAPDALKRLVEMSFSTETLLRFITDVAADPQPAVAPNHNPSVRHAHPAAAPTSPPVNPTNLPVQPEQIHRWPSDRYPRAPAAGPAPGAAAAGATPATGPPPPTPFANGCISASSGGIAETRGLLAEAPSVRAPLRQPQPAQPAYGTGGPPSQQQPQQNVTAPFAAYQRDRKREREWEWERERAGGQNDRQGAPPGSVRQEPGPLQHERTVVWPERTPPLPQAHSLVSQQSLAMHHSLPPQNSTSAGALLSQRPPSHAPAITTGSVGEPTGRKGPLLATAGMRDSSTVATPPPAGRGGASGQQPTSARTTGGRPGTAPAAAENADASAALTVAVAAEDAAGSAVRRHPGSAVVQAMVTSEGPADPRRRFIDGGAGGGGGSGGGGPAGPVRATTEVNGEGGGGERALLAANDREAAGEEAGGAGAQELMRLAAAAVEATMEEQCGREGGGEEAVYAGRRMGGFEAVATHDGHGVAAKDRMATQQDVIGSLAPNQAQHEHLKAKQ